MSAATAISATLIKFGRPMTLRRNTLTAGVLVPTDVSVYAAATNYQPAELVGGLMQGDTKVVFANTQIAAAAWPGPPIIGDQIIIDGRARTIKQVDPRYLGSVVLVFECQVRG